MKTDQIKEILNHANPAFLTGRHNAKERQRLMEVLTGGRLPIAKCGINVLMQKLFELYEVEEACLAGKQRVLWQLINI